MLKLTKIINRIFILIKDIAKYAITKIKYKFPKVMSIEDTIDLILSEKKSFVRFGDGEFNQLSQISIGFQDGDEVLSIRLKEILNCKSTDCLICIPGSLHTLSGMVWRSKLMWIHLICKYYKNYHLNFKFDVIYPNSLITRPYMDLSDKNRSITIFNKLKQIWNGRDIIIIEGEHSKLGVGNDLFFNAKSVKRLITASKNAFEKYDLILDEVLNYDKNSLILIALGPTATVLAYDLANNGFQACDVGHVDVEYEWFLSQTLNKIALQGKFVNEVSTNIPITQLNDDVYESQIILKIL